MANLTASTRSTSTKIDERYVNFYHAYVQMGYSTDDAQFAAYERFQEDKKALFTIEACTNFSTARATVYLLEAAKALCCGYFGNAEALRLIAMAAEEIKGDC